MNVSSYLANKLLAHSLGKTSFTMPTSTHLALYSSVPDDLGGTELAGTGGYGRATLSWSNPNAGVVTNSNTIRIPAVGAASSTWATSYGAGVYDDPKVGAGNLLYWVAFDDPVTIPINDAFVVLPDGYSIDLR